MVSLVLEVIGGILVLWMASAAAAVLWLRRQNRVSPKVRTRAPLIWLMSPGRAATLHRRLRRALAGARGAIEAESGLGRGTMGPDALRACIGDLERHAIVVDDHLVLAAGCSPVVRRNLLRGLAGEVQDIERLAGRIARSILAPSEAAGRPGEAARRISDRLDALDAAHAELATLEATWAIPADRPDSVVSVVDSSMGRPGRSPGWRAQGLGRLREIRRA